MPRSLVSRLARPLPLIPRGKGSGGNAHRSESQHYDYQ